MLQSSINVWVDADACPVKTEIVRVCKRHGIVPRLVSNKSLALFTDRQDVTVLTVTGDFDTAENCIVENLLPGDLVLTDEITLACRVLMEGGQPLIFGADGLLKITWMNVQPASSKGTSARKRESLRAARINPSAQTALAFCGSLTPS